MSWNPFNPREGTDPNLPIDLALLHRVYRMSAVLLMAGGILVWEPFGRPATVGLLLGGFLHLGLLLSLEWTVRRFVNPGQNSLRPLGIVSLFKLIAAAGVLGLAAFLATRGWLSLPWLLIGFVVPHAVLGLKVLGKMLTGSGEAR
ncbi:MAG: hypothetical protein FJX77_11935 [Armatimonadetes bacterium]|nr:hypothetical protein [Armatimonadota bacterium]